MQLKETESLQLVDNTDSQCEMLCRNFKAKDFYPLQINDDILTISNKEVFRHIWDHSMGRFTKHK